MQIKFASLETCGAATDTVVAVDVCRAFTTAAYAFAAGAREIILVGEVEQALALRERMPGALVMGEVGGLPVEDFDFEDLIRHSFRVMQDKLHTVQVRVSPAWAQYVGERIWHESQNIQQHIDGSIEITFHVAGLDEIRQWILSMGPEVCVLNPPELIADVSAVAPGTGFTLGVRFVMKPDWHIYWHNPGEAGLATSIRFELPEGLTAGPILWPAPMRFDQPGNILGYGYSDSVLLAAKVIVKPDIANTNALPIRAKTRWLSTWAVQRYSPRSKVSLALGNMASAPPINSTYFSEA